MTWLKRIGFLFLVWLGLYFFGDFRINDVNVRAQLRAWVPPEIVMFWKSKAVEASKSAYQAVTTTLAEDSLSSVEKTQLQNDPADEISAEDQKKLKELMQNLINQQQKK